MASNRNPEANRPHPTADFTLLKKGCLSFMGPPHLAESAIGSGCSRELRIGNGRKGRIDDSAKRGVLPANGGWETVDDFRRENAENEKPCLRGEVKASD